MTTLDPSPSVVALVQAATMAPQFLFVLFAGALADRVDKKRLLIVVNAGLVGVIAALALFVSAGRISPLGLVAFTFLIGTGAAFIAPAWQSVVPQLVPREDLSAAIALNSMGINIARAIGPAIGGFLIAAAGIATPFFLNAASCAVIVFAVLLWRPPQRAERALPPEPFFGSITTGLRHAAYNKALKATLLRAIAFFAFASAYWAMLPLIARRFPEGGSALYGAMLTAIGIGAVAGALLLPRFKESFTSNQIAAWATFGTAAAMAALAVAPAPAMAVGASLLGGVAWIAMLTSLNVSAQMALPDWVRARGLALFLMVMSGGMAGGSILWGQLAERSSVSIALAVAAAGILLAFIAVRRVSLGQGEGMDLRPAGLWEVPALDIDGPEDRGPVMVTVEYLIDPKKEEQFLAAIRAQAAERYRDGAYQWGVQQDAERRERYLEWFLVSSWTEHLRQHERVTHHDTDLQAAARRYHLGPGEPRVEHLIAPRMGTALAGGDWQ